jgi:probable F420-dependent oxidoreductase
MTDVLLIIQPSRYLGVDPKGIVEVAQRAEDAGLTGIVVTDHVVMGNRTDEYPWGRFPAPDTQWPEPFTLLTWIGAATTSIRLCTGIIIAPLRPAVVFAKTAATIDRLSGGRLDLGVGTGWQQAEFDAAGVDFASRGQILTDMIRACRALWSPGPATVALKTVNFSDVRCDPKPVKPSGPPVLFAGPLHKKNIDRIQELGDGWIPIMDESPEGVRDGVFRLREALTAAGRDAGTLRVRPHLHMVRQNDKPSLDATLDGIEALSESGATEVSLQLSNFVREAHEAPAFFARTAARLSTLGAARG